MKSRALKAGKILQANNPIVIDLERMYANADCCAKCYHLRFIQIDSKQYFFCLAKCKEITHDNTPYCKYYVDNDKYQKLIEQSKKDFKLLYNMAKKYGRTI